MNQFLENEKIMRREGYILSAIEKHCLNGDTFVSEEKLFDICKREKNNLNYEVFAADLAELFRLKLLYQENHRIYLTQIWRYEDKAASALSRILRLPPLQEAVLPDSLEVKGTLLCSEQREAVQMALSHRLSMIMGGAGSGKSTLIRALFMCAGVSILETVVCAPTGKAARNLTYRTGLTARTVHSALGLRPHDDFLSPVKWSLIKLVIVDKASMMTLEMLAGILSRVSNDCIVVLVGDSHQLLSVGAGNVLHDLQALNFPAYILRQNHRQGPDADALISNVTLFSKLNSYYDLKLDKSMAVLEMDEQDVQDYLVKEACIRYQRGESIQVLSPYNSKGPLSAAALNVRIRDIVNPLKKTKLFVRVGNRIFVNGDRVLITQNDRDHNVSNGDVGILCIHRMKGKQLTFSIKLPDGRNPMWDEDSAWGTIHSLQLGYVLTVHKSQGSEYDTILMPATMSMVSMLYRNLLYTAISRARFTVRIFGSIQAIDHAMQHCQSPRQSVLVEKTMALLHIPA